MFNLFVNRRTGEQPLDRSEQADSLLNDGMYQIPIFCQRFKPQFPFYADTCFQYDKLPASSALIRIRRAPLSSNGLTVLSINTPGFETKKKREEYGIWELPPPYNTGAYNSANCGARQNEIELAELRRQRNVTETKLEVVNKLKPIYEDILMFNAEQEQIMKTVNVKERDQKLKDLNKRRAAASRTMGTRKGLTGLSSNQPLTSNQGFPGQGGAPGNDNKGPAPPESLRNIPDQVVPMTAPPGGMAAGPQLNQTALSGSISRIDPVTGLPIKRTKKDIEAEEAAEDEQIYTILDTVFTYKKSMDFLDLKFFSKYRETGGFKMNVDGIHNLPKVGFYVTSYVLNPPGMFYLTGSRADVSVYTTFDWTKSTKSTIRYNEGYKMFSRIKFSTSLHFLIEINQVELPAFDSPSRQPVAFTIMPVFVIDELTGQGYVNSNVYQLPLFEGEITKELVVDLQTGDPWKKLQDRMAAGKLKPWGVSSVMCRLLDIQREGHFLIPFDYERAVTEYLPDDEKISALYKYTESIEQDLLKKKLPMLSGFIPYKEDPFAFNKRLTQFVIKDLDEQQKEEENETQT